MKALFSTLIATALLANVMANASGTFSLTEINPLHGNSPITVSSDSAKTYYGAGGLSGFIEMNSKLYFTAQNTPGDNELWVTDGTKTGTNLVREINPGHSAAIGNLVNVNNHVVFMATDNGTGWDLWSSDGTNSGTIKINTLNAPNNKALGPYNISLMGNRLVFCAQEKLLISDGTVSGTDSLLSITSYSQGFGYCELNGFVYFVLPKLVGSSELWRTDGTTTGTSEVLDFSAAPFSVDSVKDVISFNGSIYLITSDNTGATRLSSFDGSINGQLSSVTIPSGALSNIHGLSKYNDGLYFIANNGAYANLFGMSLSNLTPAALIPNSTINNLSNLTIVNNTAYCMEPGNSNIYAVELTGNTYNVLSLQGYHLPNYIYKDDDFLISIGQQIFFEAYDNLNNNQVLLQSDFTSSGTKTIMPAGANTSHPFNCRLNNGINDVFDLKLWNNKIIMPANFNDAGRELWMFDAGITNGVEEMKNEELLAIYPNPVSSELSIKVNSCTNCERVINVVNTEGQIVLSKILTGLSSSVKLSSLASGNYFVTLMENGEILDTKQFVVTK